MQLEISQDQYLEIEKLSLGFFHPVSKFMNEDEFNSCVEFMRLPDNVIFPLPIVFDVSKEHATNLPYCKEIRCMFNGNHVANVFPEDVYRVDKSLVCPKLFGTPDPKHPGTQYFQALGEYFISGGVELLRPCEFNFSTYEFSPTQIKEEIRQKGWKRVAGFQTRNIPHRAHEYLQKIALEHCDGLLIQPLVGFKKVGDFSPEAVIRSYQILMDQFFPNSRVIFSVISTIMRYAGPREAVFHAILRRNCGCTDFIVGRDHAGIGDYYGLYAAQQLAKELENELGIRIMDLAGPFYCNLCEGITTEKTCPHRETNPSACVDISGTYIRGQILGNNLIDSNLVRPSIIEAIRNIKEPFVT